MVDLRSHFSNLLLMVQGENYLYCICFFSLRMICFKIFKIQVTNKQVTKNERLYPCLCRERGKASVFVGVRAPSCALVTECSIPLQLESGAHYSAPPEGVHGDPLMQLPASSQGFSSPRLQCPLPSKFQKCHFLTLILGTAPRSGHLGGRLDRWGVRAGPMTREQSPVGRPEATPNHLPGFGPLTSLLSTSVFTICIRDHETCPDFHRS